VIQKGQAVGAVEIDDFAPIPTVEHAVDRAGKFDGGVGNHARVSPSIRAAAQAQILFSGADHWPLSGERGHVQELGPQPQNGYFLSRYVD